ncbi:AaceriAFR324Wp [[Ashbya] aceris (nom. inval.)]|nr:AaceriAFR324Wp [[Ashbya] aceris (nom. inval.)]
MIQVVRATLQVLVVLQVCLCNISLFPLAEDMEKDFQAKAEAGEWVDLHVFDGQWPKRPEHVTKKERTIADGEIPQYVLDHCPLVHLYSEEIYMPSDVKEFVQHFRIEDKRGNEVRRGPLDIATSFAGLGGDDSSDLYLTSLEDFGKNPSWLLGYGPDYGTGRISNGPSVLIVVDKGNGWVDAFWFYFYPFNLGPFIMGAGPWGNHVGDWEHSLVRFLHGKPQYLWMSAHGGGSGYVYDAVEKKDHWRVVGGELQRTVLKRPLIFSSRGTHANYASIGQHAHDVPFFFSPLSDFTDRGPLWDPSMNFYAYTFDGETVTPFSQRERELGTDWLYYNGRWGDKQLIWSDKRQHWCLLQWTYIDGPYGPLKKNLQRTGLCQRGSWWTFQQGCPIRRMIKRGQGLDAERNDLVGDNCGIALYKIRPKWLRALLRLITWQGLFCTFMDYFTG